MGIKVNLEILLLTLNNVCHSPNHCYNKFRSSPRQFRSPGAEAWLCGFLSVSNIVIIIHLFYLWFQYNSKDVFLNYGLQFL